MIRLFIIAVIALLPLGAAPLHLDFHPEIDNSPLIQDSLRYENSRGETFSITRLDWIATDFSLTTASGHTLAVPNTTAFIPTRGTTFTLPDLPPEKITPITFHIGPEEVNNQSHSVQFTANHPLNPNVNKLHWDWQGGYIFLALEGHWRAPDAKLPGGYAYHFARDPNRCTISLPIELDLRNESRVAIALDPRKLLIGLSFANDGATTHSAEGDLVAARLKHNLTSAFRIAGIEKGGIPTSPNPPKPIDLPANPKGYPITLPKHIPLPGDPDGFLVDTPGLREVGMWGLPSGSLDQCFPEFAPFLGECRFQDCKHDTEPGCAVRDALAGGRIKPSRYESYLKLRGELVASENVW